MRRISLVKVIGWTLVVTWAVFMVTELRVGRFLPAFKTPTINKEKGSYYESLYYATLYDDDSVVTIDQLEADDTNTDGQSGLKTLSKVDSITLQAEQELEKDFLDVVSSYLENINYYRAELKQANPLHKLGFYKSFDERYLRNTYNGKSKYKLPHMGLMNEPSYCEIADFYNLHTYENLFEEAYFFTDYNLESFVRKDIIGRYGVDTMPSIHYKMPRSETKLKKHFLDKRITMFFTKKDNFHYYHEVGKNFLGFSQMYNHIPGSNVLSRYDVFSKYLQVYEQNFVNSPSCFNRSNLFVKTYNLNEKSECQEFFALINRPDHTNLSLENIWIYKDYKPSTHTFKRGRMNLVIRDELNQQYNSGEGCGTVKDYGTFYQDIERPILTNNSMPVLLRTYVLISSTNPLKVYMHEGHFSDYREEDFFSLDFKNYTEKNKSHVNEQILSGDIIVDFDDNAQDQISSKASIGNDAALAAAENSTHYGGADIGINTGKENFSNPAAGFTTTKKSSVLTIINSTMLSQAILSGRVDDVDPYTGVSNEKDEDADEVDPSESEELDEASVTFPEHSKTLFDGFLMDKVSDIFDRQEFKRKISQNIRVAVAHAIRLNYEKLYSASGVFELFAVDFAVDNEYNTRLVGFEPSPSVRPETDNIYAHFFKNLFNDVFQIEYSYLRSRMLRLHNFMQQYHRDVVTSKRKPIAEYKSIFDSLNSNNFELYLDAPRKSKIFKLLDLGAGSEIRFSTYINSECLSLISPDEVAISDTATNASTITNSSLSDNTSGKITAATAPANTTANATL